MANEAEIEQEIQDKGLTAPRITPADIEFQIVDERYIRATAMSVCMPLSSDEIALSDRALGCLTICVLVLRNGFTIVGKSACASPENYDAELGCKIAREDAKRQIWALEGYRLRSVLAAKAS